MEIVKPFLEITNYFFVGMSPLKNFFENNLLKKILRRDKNR